jgi:hypothetical protein
MTASPVTCLGVPTCKWRIAILTLHFWIPTQKWMHMRGIKKQFISTHVVLHTGCLSGSYITWLGNTMTAWMPSEDASS